MLEFKKVYQNNDGDKVVIIGATKNYPEYAWSLNGDWYEISTGKFVFYNHNGGYYVSPTVSRRDINMSLKPIDWEN